MNKLKKLNIVFLLLTACVFSQVNAYSADKPQSKEKIQASAELIDDSAINEKISRIGFNKIFSQDPQKEIQDIFSKYAKYSTKQDFEKLENLFADNYINADGFNKKTYFDMIKKTWDLYPEVVYTASIKDIKINNEYAIVQLNEKAYGETKEAYEGINDKGLIQSDSLSFYYLQKFGNAWKITSSSVISETTSLRYGETKNLNLSITAPSQVKAGEEYTASLNLDVPQHSFILASISNEPIIYPQKTPEDVFRNIKRDGILERVLTANKDNYNELAVASVGITKAAILDTQNINIKVTGMAFLMTRVNVINIKNVVLKSESK